MVDALRRILGNEKVRDGEAILRAYDCDAYTIDRSKPTCVVLPESTEEVAAVVRWCAENRVPFTPRGAGTGLSGGAMPALGGVVISTKRLTKILEIDIENRCLKAQAGIANKRISDAVAHAGLHFAPDPSSQTVSTLGGNIAENSGGPHTLKYGVTAQHILGLTMVDPTGEVLELGGKVPGSPGYDFVGLVVGSEGTLGVVTEAWVKLTPLPAAIRTALIAFPTVRDASECVGSILASGVIPAALEMMDRGIMNALRVAFGLDFPESAQALLLVEVDSPPLAPMNGGERGQRVRGLECNAPSLPQERVDAEMQAVTSLANQHNALRIDQAKDEPERQKLWTARKKGIGAMGRLAPSIVTHDGVIPRSKLPEMLDFVYAVAAEKGINVANLFHAGDGNLHPCFYFDDRDPKQVEAVVEAGETIMRKCVELGGSLTGEHGVGVEKAELMSAMFTPDDLRLQAMAKAIFNDGLLCNPCKVFPSQKGCVEHRSRWRGVAT